MKGFSPSNLKYMRLFARGWPDSAAIGQQPAGQLPWGHLMLLLDKLDTLELRDWYAAAAVRHGWTRDVLRHQIATAFHERAAAAGSSFAQALERSDSELAQQITKYPYILDFLALDGDA
jgi:predicted nuclease of restriction endonuclease-like (RecB) superfamily